MIALGCWELRRLDADGTRELGIVVARPGQTIASQILELERVAVGWSHRWHARCPGDCEGGAQKLYLVDRQFRCWKCSGLQYRSAAKHNARVYGLAKSPGDLLEAMQRLSATGRVSLGTLRAMERRMPALFRPFDTS